MKVELSLMEDLVDLLEMSLEYIDDNVTDQPDHTMGFDRDWANDTLLKANEALMKAYQE